MKMGGLGLKEEVKGRDGVGGFGRTIVVGVEMDALSRELLTWALVKVAEGGDRVVALHVLHRREVLDEEGKSSLLSHLKTFESMLSVYEDFCNLKQIDLKLKISRGSSARRILVQEAKSISANIVVVGISRKCCTFGFSASVAKYCARKLPLECWVLAVNNGKVEYQRESKAAYVLSDLCPLPNGYLGLLHWSRSKNSKVVNGGALKQPLLKGERTGKNEGHWNYQDLGSRSDCCVIGIDNSLPHSSSIRSCSICAPDSVSREEASCSEGQKPSALHRSWSKKSKVFNGGTLKQPLLKEERIGKNEGHRNYQDLGSQSDCCVIGIDNSLPHSSSIRSCSICAPDSDLQEEASCSEGQRPSALRRSWSENSKVFNGGTLKQPLLKESTRKNEGHRKYQDLGSQSDRYVIGIDNSLPHSSSIRSCSICAPNSVSREESSCSEGQRPSALHRSWSKNSKFFNGVALKQRLLKEERKGKNEGHPNDQDLGSQSDHCVIGIDNSLPHGSSIGSCSISAPDSVSQEEAFCSEGQRSSTLHPACLTKDAGENSSAMVSIEASDSEPASSSNSLLMLELPKVRPGWPLLHKAITHSWQAAERSMVKEVSVVEWAMQLPTRHSIADVGPDHKPVNAKLRTPATNSVLDGANLNEDSGAIVGIGNTTSFPLQSAQLNKTANQLEYLHNKYSSTCRLFGYHELQSATSNFSSENLIGKGGHSRVYKGHLPDGKELAVKILKSSEDALKEVCLEIEIISSLHHSNIISLLGFCFEENKPILVHDFVSKGSLEENLHGRKDNIVLTWSRRYNVAIHVAAALNYLHSGTAQPVIHRDVKSSNILLNDDYEPKLSDFGLAIWASMSSAQMACSDVAGTFGYLAPEYFMYGKVSEKIDVYAFGVVLLELLSGRKPINNEYPKGQESLIMWAKPLLQSRKFMQLLDPNLGDNFDNHQLEKMVLAASLCIRRAPRFRPRMSLILKLLQGDDDAIMKWARLQVISSEDFDLLYDEASPASDIQSHLNLALLDVEDDSLSVSSIEHSVNYSTVHKSLDDYLQERWSRSSSFD